MFNINCKKGITFLSMLATIVVIMILVGAVVISANNLIPETVDKKFAKEIYTVQKKVEEYNFKNSAYPVEDANIDYTIPDEYQDQFNGETITDSVVILKPIDLVKADIEDTYYGNKQDGEDDIYAVSDITGRVYYLKGYNGNSKAVKGKIYYTLTSDLSKMIGISNVK